MVTTTQASLKSVIMVLHSLWRDNSRLEEFHTDTGRMSEGSSQRTDEGADGEVGVAALVADERQKPHVVSAD